MVPSIRERKGRLLISSFIVAEMGSSDQAKTRRLHVVEEGPKTAKDMRGHRFMPSFTGTQQVEKMMIIYGRLGGCVTGHLFTVLVCYCYGWLFRLILPMCLCHQTTGCTNRPRCDTAQY